MARTIAPLLLGVQFLPDFDYDGVMNLRDFALLAQSLAPGRAGFRRRPAARGRRRGRLSGPCRPRRLLDDFPGLIAHWKLDETDGNAVPDALGRFDGTVHGSPAYGGPDEGKIRGALELDGIDDYITAGSVLNPAGGPFTVFLWVKGGQPGQVILSQSNPSGAGRSMAWHEHRAAAS